MKNNYFIIRLHLLILSPIFASLLTFVLLIVYKIYFEPSILCDEGGSPLLLQQLEQNLREEKSTQSVINSEIIYFKEWVQERLNNSASGELTSAQKAYKKVIFDG
jgi:hypothetical protein